MFLCLKRWDTVKELVAEDTKTPNVHACIMLYALHCHASKKANT